MIKSFIWRILKNIKYLCTHTLSETELELRYRIKDETLDDLLYEWEENKSSFKTLNVLDEDESFELIFNKPKSFCRFGDGEIKLIWGENQGFQVYDSELAEKLVDILNNNRDDIYVGLNRAYFHTPTVFAERNRRFYRLYGTAFRRFFIENCNQNATYLDAGFLGAYFRFGDEYDFEKHYANVRKMFEGKKLCIVSGEGVIEKLKFDVFDNARERIVIHGPSRNAYAEYKSILNEIEKTVDTSYIICLILGMTAKVLVPELTDRGYIAWDVGHVAKDYDAYMNKFEKTEKVMESFWAPD